MERNREARRGSMPAVNGGGLSRRRQRGSGLRDSPEEDGAMEMPETLRLRERASKRDRERDRSTRSKRRRPDRMMHGGGRDEGEDSSGESMDEEEEDEEDEPGMSHRLPAPPSASSPAPSSAAASQNAHLRRSLPPAALAKPLRPPLPVWKVADEMMGVSVPRKARSASGKRSHDSWVSGGGVGGGGGGADQIHRQASTSPARPSTASTAQVSPSSSNASVRKKLKPVGGATQRPPKSSKSSAAEEDIEFEVAEVLFGMTQRFQGPGKHESHKIDSKDANGSISEGKSGASSPISQQSAQPQLSFSNQGTTAPKRKRPRPVKFEDESPTSPPKLPALSTASMGSATKLQSEEERLLKVENSLPRSEDAALVAVENGWCLPDPVISQATTAPAPTDAQHELTVKPESNQVPDLEELTRELDGTYQMGMEMKEDAAPVHKEAPCSDFVVNVDESKSGKVKGDLAAHKLIQEKFSIDLMAPPPPGKLSPERDDCVAVDPSTKTEVELMGDLRREDEKMKVKESREISTEDLKEKHVQEELNLKKHIGKERTLDSQFDLEKPDGEALRDRKEPVQTQQMKAAKVESKPEKPGPSAVSLPLPMPVSGWPGNLPAFGYMGQLPSLQTLLPMDVSSGSSKPLQPINILPPQRPKRCATHCFIAQTIHYHQQLAKMNLIWPAAASTMQLYGAKPYNLNALPPAESAVLGNSMQGNQPGRSLISLQDKSGSSVVAGYMGHSTREKSSVANNLLVETGQRKQLMLQQGPQPGSATNMLHGPALLFPFNQHPAGAAAASRPVAPNSSSGAGNAASSSSATTNSGMANLGTGVAAAAVNFNYASLPPNEAQYLAILQNNGYPFLPAHVGASPYRGASPAQAIPFYGGSLYSSQMVHPSQLQQQPAPQQTNHGGHQNKSTSSGSSSSQKHPHSQRVPGTRPAAVGGGSHSFPASKQAQHLSETGCEDSPLTIDGRVSQAQKSICSNNFAMPIHPQNFALISPAAAAAAAAAALGGGSHSEKQLAAQHQGMKVELTPSQAYAMSFASLTGAAAAAAAGSAPLGLDFSAMAQNHAIFQSLPVAARHGYQMAAAGQAVQQHKKAQHQDDGKSLGESLNATMAGEGERNVISSGKAPVSGSQQSLTFSRSDCEAPVSSILTNSFMDCSSRMVNLIPPATGGGRVPNRTANAAPTTSSTVTAAVGSLNTQQQQLIQLQKQQQQQMPLQHQLAGRTKSSALSDNAGAYSERLPAGSTVTKFPQALSNFPQALIHGGGNCSQSPQWKTSRSATTPVPSPSAAPSSSIKSQLPQQQSRGPQQSPVPAHQTQISFGVSSLKMAAGSTGQSSMPSLSSAASILVGSFPNPLNKGTGGGSPQASMSGKSVPTVPAPLPLPQQVSDKNSQSSSGLKPSPSSNRNMPSILGHPNITPAPSSSSKQQLQSQPQQKPLYPQAQLFFSSAYMPSQSAQSNAATMAAAYYQRHQSELHSQQSQQHNSNPASMGLLSLCSSALTVSAAPATNDPAKAMAASVNLKGLQAPGLLQHSSQPASAGPYPLISAAAAGFPYIHAMPSVSMKPPEQKPAAGNDSLNASWQPENR